MPGRLPLPPIEAGAAVEVERAVSRLGHVSLAGHEILAAEILGGRPVGIRIEAATMMFCDLKTRELRRTRPNPSTQNSFRDCLESGRRDRQRGRQRSRSGCSGAQATPG